MCSGVRRLCIVLIINNLNNLIGALLVMINSPIHYISDNPLRPSCNPLWSHPNKGDRTKGLNGKRFSSGTVQNQFICV